MPQTPHGDKQKPPRKPFSYLRFAGLGIQLVSYILIMALLGYWLDNLTGTDKPWWLLTLSVLGIIFAIVHLVRITGRGQL